MNRRHRHRRTAAWLAALVAAPVIEVAVIVLVARAIGGWPTFALLVLEGAAGMWLVRREGTRSWDALRTALATGRMPAHEVADAALVLVGGILIMLPGFVSGLVGLLVVLPVTRPMSRTILQVVLARRLLAAAPGFGGPVVAGRTVPPSRSDGDSPGGRSAQDEVRGDGPDDDIIEGEIL